MIYRYYYRCTYKHDEGCKATKQVQRIQVKPPVFRTTYFGNHTCNNLHNDHELIMEGTGTGTGTSSDTSKFITFDGSNLTNREDQYPLIFSSTNKKYKDEIISYDLEKHDEYLSSSDYFVSSNLEAVESLGPMMVSTSLESDFDSVIYGLMKCVDLDLDVFQS